MNQSMSEILTLLERSTANGRANWQASGRPAEFVFPLGKTVLVLSKNPYSELFGGGVAGPFKLSVLSESGSELISTEANSGDTNYARLKNLYENVRGKARGVEDVLDDVRKELLSLR